MSPLPTQQPFVAELVRNDRGVASIVVVVAMVVITVVNSWEGMAPQPQTAAVAAFVVVVDQEKERIAQPPAVAQFVLQPASSAYAWDISVPQDQHYPLKVKLVE